MRCGSITYRRKFLLSINPQMESESEEISITLFLDEADKLKGMTAEKAFELAKQFVMSKAENKTLTDNGEQ